MQTIKSGYRAVGILWDVSWERIVFPAAIVLSLALGAQLGELGLFWITSGPMHP